jgi:putative thioredoxin
MDFGTLKPAAGGGTPGADLIKDTTAAGFAKDVIEASKDGLVIVDFWAAWCAPCKQLAPVLDKVVKSYGGKVRLVKVDTDAHPAIAAQLRVQSLPTVYAFRDGRPLDGFTGAQPESVVREFVDRLLGDEQVASLETVLAAADQALEDSDLQGAAEAYTAVLHEDQHHPVALAGLAQCYLKSGDAARAQQMLDLVPPDKRETAAVKGVQAALDLASKASGADNRGELEAQLVANPKDHQVRYDLSVALAARGQKDEAVDHLLEIVRRERNWNEEAARKQLVQLFEAWGPKDEATVAGRKKLSSILFA